MKKVYSYLIVVMLVLSFSAISYAEPLAIIDREEFGELIYEVSEDTFSFDPDKVGNQTHFILNPSDTVYIGSKGSKNEFLINNSEILLEIHAEEIGEGSYGILKKSLNVNDFTLGENGGSLITFGGNSPHTAALYVDNSFTQKAGFIYSIGGGDYFSVGTVIVGDSIIEDGYIYALGGTGVRAYGLAGNKVIFNGGKISARSGTGVEAIGFIATTLTQNGGVISAYAGDSDQSFALYVDLYEQNEGVLHAIGGTGELAVGVRVDGTMNIAGTLVIARQGESHSVWISKTFNSGKITIESTATIIPIVDLSKPAELASGLIGADVGMEIKDGAIVAPKLENTYILSEVNDALVDVPFIKVGLVNSKEKIVGELNNIEDTITMSYTLKKGGVDDKEYLLDIVRTKTPGEALVDGGVGTKYVDLISNVYDVVVDSSVGGDSPYWLLIKLIDAIDNSFDVDAAMDVIDSIANTNELNSALNLNDMIIRKFNTDRIGLLGKVDSISNGDQKTWANITYDYNQKGASLVGVSLGYASKSGNIAFAVEARYIDGVIFDRGVKNDGSALSVLATVEYFLAGGKVWNPSGGITIGYDESTIPGVFESKSLIVGVDVSNKFQINDIITIEPTLGLTYIPVMIDGVISEDFWVYGINFSSLEINSRIHVDFKLSDVATIGVRAFANYDISGKKSFEENLAQGEGQALIKALLEDSLRLSWGVGVDVEFNVPITGVNIDVSCLVYMQNGGVNYSVKSGIGITF